MKSLLAPLSYSLTGGYSYKHSVDFDWNQETKVYKGQIILSELDSSSGRASVLRKYNKLHEGLRATGFKLKTSSIYDIQGRFGRSIGFYKLKVPFGFTSLSLTREVSDRGCFIDLSIRLDGCTKKAIFVRDKVFSYLERSFKRTNPRGSISDKKANIIDNFTYQDICFRLKLAFY